MCDASLCLAVVVVTLMQSQLSHSNRSSFQEKWTRDCSSPAAIPAGVIYIRMFSLIKFKSASVSTRVRPVLNWRCFSFGFDSFYNFGK